MEVRTLGRLGRAFGDAGGSVPPSSQSVVRMLRGEQGGVAAVIGSTLLRALLFIPTTAGVSYFAGARRWKLAGLTAAGSLGSSLAITMFLIAWHKVAGTADQQMAPPAPPSVAQVPSGPPVPIVDPSQLPQTSSTSIANQVLQQTTSAVDSAMQTQAQTDSPTAGLHLRGAHGRSFGSSW